MATGGRERRAGMGHGVLITGEGEGMKNLRRFVKLYVDDTEGIPVEAWLKSFVEILNGITGIEMGIEAQDRGIPEEAPAPGGLTETKGSPGLGEMALENQGVTAWQPGEEKPVVVPLGTRAGRTEQTVAGGGSRVSNSRQGETIIVKDQLAARMLANQKQTEAEKRFGGLM
jgi:hypothetical protein